MFVCEEENLKEAYMGDTFMKEVIGVAKAIANKKKIPLYLSESEIRKLDREEAVQEGYDSGYNSGYDFGKAEGLSLGIEQKQTEMIINLYNNGASLDLISKSSGLSIEEVNNIIENNK